MNLYLTGEFTENIDLLIGSWCLKLLQMLRLKLNEHLSGLVLDLNQRRNPKYVPISNAPPENLKNRLHNESQTFYSKGCDTKFLKVEVRC